MDCTFTKRPDGSTCRMYSVCCLTCEKSTVCQLVKLGLPDMVLTAGCMDVALAPEQQGVWMQPWHQNSRAFGYGPGTRTAGHFDVALAPGQAILVTIVLQQQDVVCTRWQRLVCTASM